MTQTATEQSVQTVDIHREIEIAASIDIVFEATLAELGPEGQMPGGMPFPMKIEPWPGGRWFRDLGNDAGHFWGHVQVIKPPKLLEICGPMFMSYPALSHVQYRFTEQGGGTRVAIVHRAMGLIPQEHREGVAMGWQHGLERIREIALRKVGEKGGAR